MSDWPEIPLREVLSEPTRNGIHKGVAWQGRGTPVIKMGEVYSSEYVGHADRDLLELTDAEVHRFSVRDDDLLFCRTSLVADGVGRCALVKGLKEQSCFASNLIRVRVDALRADARFVHWIFRSPLGQELRRSIARGTSVTTITGPDLTTLKIPLPPLAEQRTIAGVLGALDDKIESNRRIIATVDSLARAELAAAALASDAEEVSFGALAERINEPADPKSLDVTTPYIGLEHMPRGTMILDEWGVAEGLASGKSRFRRGDVLFGKLRPYFRKVGVAPVAGICSTDVLVLRPRRGLALLAAAAASDGLIEYASAAASGTKMPRVSWDYVAAFKITVPGTASEAVMEATMGPAIERSLKAVDEIRSASALRDALLPELLSGRLRVRDAEQAMSEAV